VLEELYLAEAFHGRFSRLVRTAEVVASFLGEHVVAVFSFDDHKK
jgi:hypothetical protein